MVTIIKMSARGTVTLPKELRKKLAMKGEEMLIAESTDEGILLKPAATYPIELYSDERLAEFANADKALEQFFRKQRL